MKKSALNRCSVFSIPPFLAECAASSIARMSVDEVGTKINQKQKSGGHALLIHPMCAMNPLICHP
jgi:hypothetical protein